MGRIVIVGSGAAGYAIAAEIRKINPHVTLTIVTSDNGRMYSKSSMSKAFTLGVSALQLVQRDSDEMSIDLSAQILINTDVKAIDRDLRIIHSTEGPLHYDNLVLATGASPIQPLLTGSAQECILHINCLEDYITFRSHMALQRNRKRVRVAILGAGLTGCEFADDLSCAGHQVAVIDRENHLMSSIDQQTYSSGLQRTLEDRGVIFKLGSVSSSVDHSAKGLRLTLASGESIEVDVVLSAVGIRPNVILAKSCGLEVRDGILIDKFGRTSDPNIFSLGDCAEYENATAGQYRTMFYMAPLLRSAEALASTILGNPSIIDFNCETIISNASTLTQDFPPN